MTVASDPPSACRRCGRSDANWIVSALGCAHCFDPFATAMQLALLKKVADSAEEVVHGRRSLDELRQVLEQWKAHGTPLETGKRRSVFPT